MVVLLRVLVALWLLGLAACDDVTKKVSNEVVAAVDGGLVFEPIELDMGDVIEGDKLEATLLIRNNSDDFSHIIKVESSCGCTTAEPEMKILAAGAFTLLHVEVDSFGKRGDIRKSITVTDQKGRETTAWLSMHVKKNSHTMDIKRSIFDGKCAACHVAPALGKSLGKDIYTAVCEMCHGVDAQGAYAPSLRSYEADIVLATVISNGTGTHHMPAFAQDLGGPLSQKQINTLAQWIISLDE
ncbi:MAG: DUF1573 domain-containing protein [Mariprofundaceae bacterium]